LKGLSIRVRLTAGYLLVLSVATLLLALGSWWLFRESIVQAADATLTARIEGARRFIETAQRALPPESVSDEFKEFADMTHGEALLEVLDDTGRTLMEPALPVWKQLRTSMSPPGALRIVPIAVGGTPFRAVATEFAVDDHRYQLWAATSMSTAYGALARLRWLLMALVPAVLLVGAAGGFWISGRALAPVDRITRDVQSISWRNLDRRLDVPAADDELRRLAVTFNDMLGRLQTAVDEMVRFTADASHELRTPVSLTRTTAEVALAKERPVVEYREALIDISKQMERTSALVNDLLLLARFDAGLGPGDNTRVDLNHIVDEASGVLRSRAVRHDLALSVDLSQEPAAVQGSAESLGRLLLILLDNAVKYTPRGGRVSVRVSSLQDVLAAGPAVAVDVMNSGPGLVALDVTDQARAFDRFYRGAAARQAAPDGSGLGLSIARTIVERHAGEITLSATPQGDGCWVRVLLPSALLLR